MLRCRRPVMRQEGCPSALAQRLGDAALIAQCAVERQALITPPQCRAGILLLLGQEARIQITLRA